MPDSHVLNELFDLNERDTAQLYQQLLQEIAKPRTNDDERLSTDQIAQAIKDVAAQRTGDGIFLIGGMYTHIIGALIQEAYAKRFNLKYLPMEGTQITTKTPDASFSKQPLGIRGLKPQMEGPVRVAGYIGRVLGIPNCAMENVRYWLDHLAQDLTKPTLTVVVENKVIRTLLYTKPEFVETQRRFYDQLCEQIRIKRSSKARVRARMESKY